MFYFKKGLLFALFYEYLNHNLAALNYPNHLVSVRKRDTRNIKEINVPGHFRKVKLNSSLIDWSKIERLSKHQFHIALPCKRIRF